MNKAMDAERIRGAVYVPARAYNAFQMWHEYNPEIMERDISYAKSLGLNALRFWCSYERWLEDREGLEKAMKDLFRTAERGGIRLLVSAFEGCGVEPSRETLLDKDPWTAVCVASPGNGVIGAPDAWRQPFAYLGWLVETFGRHPALLALEPMNEPHHAVDHTRFVRALFRESRRIDPTCRLSHGALGGVLLNIVVMDLGVEVLQAHENFPASVEAFEEELRKAELLAVGMEKEIHVTEWQRVRRGGPGWEAGAALAPGEWAPDYASLAPAIHSHPRLGNFFWSLMLKSAYLPGQRRNGTLNGVFHEDGSVFSLADARAISGNPGFTARERREWPEWAVPAARKAGLQGF
jgi:hypothetical protein